MSPEELPSAWVPIFIAWRHVVAGDVVLGGDGALWHIAEVDESGTWIAERGRQTYESRPDPDATIAVLVPVTERDAIELGQEQLGARLVQRRTG